VPTSPAKRGTAKTITVEPGNGNRYFIVYGDDFVALPDYGVAATMTPHPVEYGYIMTKLQLTKPDAIAVFEALNPHKVKGYEEPAPEFTIPRPDWVSDRLIEERGEYAGFQMYTREGNDACAKLVLSLAARVEDGRLPTRAEAVLWLQNGAAILASSHPEVHDTEPEWAIVDAVNALLSEHGFAVVNREGLFS